MKQKVKITKTQTVIVELDSVHYSDDCDTPYKMISAEYKNIEETKESGENYMDIVELVGTDNTENITIELV